MNNTLNLKLSPNQFRHQIDVEYEDDKYGPVVVEATFLIEAAYTTPDSDWEAKDWYDLEGYAAYKDGEPVYIDIPYDVLYTALMDQIRTSSLQHELNHNEGF